MFKRLSRRRSDVMLFQLELRTDVVMVLKAAAVAHRLAFEDYAADILLEAAKKQALENLSNKPAVTR